MLRYRNITRRLGSSKTFRSLGELFSRWRPLQLGGPCREMDRVRLTDIIVISPACVRRLSLPQRLCCASRLAYVVLLGLHLAVGRQRKVYWQQQQAAWNLDRRRSCRSLYLITFSAFSLFHIFRRKRTQRGGRLGQGCCLVEARRIFVEDCETAKRVPRVGERFVSRKCVPKSEWDARRTPRQPSGLTRSGSCPIQITQCFLCLALQLIMRRRAEAGQSLCYVVLKMMAVSITVDGALQSSRREKLGGSRFAGLLHPSLLIFVQVLPHGLLDRVARGSTKKATGNTWYSA